MGTLLTLEDIKTMEPIIKRGKTAEASGYSYLTGVEARNKPYVTDERWRLEAYRYYLEGNEEYIANVMNENGYTFGVGPKDRKNDSANDRTIGIRIVETFSSLEELSKIGEVRVAEDGVIEFQYGEYPQTIVYKDMQEILEDLFNKGELKTNGEHFTRDARNPLYYDVDYYADEHYYDNNYLKPKEKYEGIQDEVYLHDGKKYVRTVSKISNEGIPINGKPYQRDEMVWVEVEPITWLVDQEQRKMVTERIMFGGIAPEDEGIDIHTFIDEIWSKEIIQKKRTIKPSVAVASLAQQHGESILEAITDIHEKSGVEEEKINGD